MAALGNRYILYHEHPDDDPVMPYDYLEIGTDPDGSFVHSDLYPEAASIVGRYDDAHSMIAFQYALRGREPLDPTVTTYFSGSTTAVGGWVVSMSGFFNQVITGPGQPGPMSFGLSGRWTAGLMPETFPFPVSEILDEYAIARFRPGAAGVPKPH